MAEEYYVGVDCGTASVRAALVSSTGDIICSHSEPIDIYNPKTDFYEQSTDNIWNKTCLSIQCIIKKCNVNNICDKIKGIGFDATCSLVVLHKNNEPLSVSPTNKQSHNVILWMDHRAIKETEIINSTQNKEVLSFVGGKMFVEMEIPKILWLKRNKPKTYNKASKFMDLADFLTFKATQNDVRSICTLACKWSFRGDLIADEKRDENGFMNARRGWNDKFFRDIGLEDMVNLNYITFGSKVGDLGQSIPFGLCKESAEQMGLKKGISVSIGCIDAHCGAIGLLGANDFDLLQDIKLYERIALICGSSTCHMLPIQDKLFVDGVWGPYFSALIPNLWLLEGGQSATGILIDYMIKSFHCFEQIEKESQDKNISIYQYLNDRLLAMADGKTEDIAYLSHSVHINPYFHGNRSPLSDNTLQGMMVGCKLSDLSDIDRCCIYYLATLQALCYDSKFILDTIVQKGVNIKCVSVAGGLSKNKLFLQLHADITQLPIVVPKYEDSVLIGAATLGLLAHKNGKMKFEEAMKKMNHAKTAIMPMKSNKLTKFHGCKYKIFQKMIADFKEYQGIMNDFSNHSSQKCTNKPIQIIDKLLAKLNS